MRHKVVLIEHKTLDMLMDYVGENIGVSFSKNHYSIRVDGKHYHTRKESIDNIYISNDDLMFNKLIHSKTDDPNGKEEWWDILLLDQTKEYSYKEIKDKFYKR